MIHWVGLLFIIGIILAGSDGPAFPLPNLAGVACLAIAAIKAQKLDLTEGDDDRT